MKKVFFIFLFAYCLLPIADCYSQAYPDAGSWNTFNLDKEISKKITALFTQECRIKENFSRLNLFYTNLGIEYKVAKNFKAALVYRWIDKYQDDNTFSFRHRLMLDLTVKHKFGRFTASYRNRTQVEKRDIYSSENGKVAEWYSRNKFALKYDLNRKFTPYASVEFRYQIHDRRNIESESTWHRSRYALGCDYNINTRNTFGVYYLVQQEYNVLLPNDLYIIGLEYSLSL
jgi:hypothetical protein